MHPQLDLIDQLIRMFGWPALLGALVWVVRKWDKATDEFRLIHATTVETRQMVADTLTGVNTIQNNHLTHLEAEVKEQTPILANMDKTLAVIAAKLER